MTLMANVPQVGWIAGIRLNQAIVVHGPGCSLPSSVLEAPSQCLCLWLSFMLHLPAQSQPDRHTLPLGVLTKTLQVIVTFYWPGNLAVCLFTITAYLWYNSFFAYVIIQLPEAGFFSLISHVLGTPHFGSCLLPMACLPDGNAWSLGRVLAECNPSS